MRWGVTCSRQNSRMLYGRDKQPPIVTIESQITMTTNDPKDIPALDPLQSGKNDNPAAGIDAASPLNEINGTAAHPTRKRLAMADPAALATPAELTASKRRNHQVEESAQFDGEAAPEWVQDLRRQIQTMQQAIQQTIQQMQHGEESAQFDGAATPKWAQGLRRQIQDDMPEQTASLQQMQQQMQQMQQTMQQMQQTMQQMQQQMQQQNLELRWLIQEESARSKNRSLRSNQDRMEPLIRTRDGTSPTAEPHNLWFPANNEELYYAEASQVNALLAFYSLETTGLVPERKKRLRQHLQVIL